MQRLHANRRVRVAS